ncbi:hypothetical protein SO802_015372 [Lithocarpus litseifolius]|uniref:Uncharacterized protein n=1 Tax=Lithocarpus litseifolius TaxID=425828 RepID=A0AAW2CX42_9ROSI
MASASSEKGNNASVSSAMGVLAHTSPAFVLELETSASNTKGNAEVTNAKISLVELQIPNDLGLMDETFADVPFEQELNFEPESEFDPFFFDNIGQFFVG